MTDEPRETKDEGWLGSKAVSRRDFLKYAGLAGGTIVAAGGLGGLLAACGGTTTTTQPASTGTTGQSTGSSTPGSTAASATTTSATSSTPSIMTYGVVYQVSESGNPNNDQFGFLTDDCVYEKLVKYDVTTNEFVPVLAERWEKSADNLTWTFHLRQGVKFHDGTPFDSAAAKMAMDMGAKGAQGYKYGSVASVETPDASTMVVTLSAAYPLLWLLGSTPWVVSPTAIQTYADKAYDPGNGAGTGAYSLKAVSTTVECTMERNPNWWGWTNGQLKGPDVVVMRQISEPAVLVQNLEQGVVQIAYTIPNNDVKRLQGNADLKIYVKPANDCQMLNLNCKKAPTDDVNFRQALYHAMPYDDIAKLVFNGFATPAAGFIGPAAYGYDKQVSALGLPKQDMAAAKAALAKSKYPDGATVICYTDFTGTKAMELYKAALTELKITLDVQTLDVGVIMQDGLSDNPPQNAVCQIIPGIVNGAGDLKLLLATTAGMNFSKWSDPQMDALIADAYNALIDNRDLAVDKIIEAGKLVREQVPQINMLNTMSISGTSAKLQGFDGFHDEYFMTPTFYSYSMGQ